MSVQQTSLILVHLGTDVPSYLETCIQQVRLWSSVPIYLIVFDELKEYLTVRLSHYTVTVVATSELPQTENHSEFLKTYTNYDKQFRNGYWLFVIERFYYMEELMILYNLEKAIHMEYDVMLYEDIVYLYPAANSIKNMALAFDNDSEGYPSFIFIHNLEALQLLNGFIAITCNNGLTDMRLLSAFRWIYPNILESLPQIPTITYKGNCQERSSISGLKPREPPAYLANKFEELGERIFDSLAIGQWISGVDCRNSGGNQLIEYENENAFYKVSEFGVSWRKDALGRWYPVSTKGEYRIVNIHIHSKLLSYFLSNRLDEPKSDYKNIQLFKVIKS